MKRSPPGGVKQRSRGGEQALEPAGASEKTTECLKKYLGFFTFGLLSVCSLHIPTDYVCLPEFLTTEFCRKIFSEKIICVRIFLEPPPRPQNLFSRFGGFFGD